MAIRNEWEPLLIARHSFQWNYTDFSREYFWRFNLLENGLRIVWPCASVTGKLWLQLMRSDFLAPQGLRVRSGNTKLSSRVNRTTLSKQNSSSTWKGSHQAYRVQFCSRSRAGMLLWVPSPDGWVRLEVPTTAHPWPPVLILQTTPMTNTFFFAQPQFYF